MLRAPVTAADHILGPRDATLMLIEYGDYECPYCGRAFEVMAKLRREFGEDLGFVFRNFPLQAVHPSAMKAARAAESAGLQGKFWEMHEQLFTHQDDLDDESLLTLAAKINLELEPFVRDLSGARVVRHIRGDIEGGERSGVDGTPAFFINGLRYEGVWEFEPFRDYLRGMLREGMERAA